jgi:HK97 gp10 family phage protein
MSVEVNIDPAGFEEFNQAMQRFDTEMRRQLQETLSQWAENTRNDAARLAPVRTGYLRSSTYIRLKEWNAEIGAEATYAANVEYGTSRMQAKPFLHPAVQARLPELENAFLHSLDAAKVEAGL